MNESQTQVMEERVSAALGLSDQAPAPERTTEPTDYTQSLATAKSSEEKARLIEDHLAKQLVPDEQPDSSQPAQSAQSAQPALAAIPPEPERPVDEWTQIHQDAEVGAQLRMEGAVVYAEIQRLQAQMAHAQRVGDTKAQYLIHESLRGAKARASDLVLADKALKQNALNLRTAQSDRHMQSMFPDFDPRESVADMRSRGFAEEEIRLINTNARARIAFEESMRYRKLMASKSAPRTVARQISQPKQPQRVEQRIDQQFSKGRAGVMPRSSAPQDGQRPRQTLEQIEQNMMRKLFRG